MHTLVPHVNWGTPVWFISQHCVKIPAGECVLKRDPMCMVLGEGIATLTCRRTWTTTCATHTTT